MFSTKQLNVFNKTDGKIYEFIACDKAIFNLMPDLSLLNDSQKTSGLHTLIRLKPKMLVELCVGNYNTSDGLVNGADGTFQLASQQNNTTIIWIHFTQQEIGQQTRLTNQHLYNLTINTLWTPIFPITKEIFIGKSETKRLIRKQFPIQQAATRTIHRSQGLTLEEIALCPKKVNKHGLTCIALSCVRSPNNLYLLSPLTNKNFILIIQSFKKCNEYPQTQLGRFLVYNQNK